MGDRSIVIDARIISRPQCRGISRATLGFAERFPDGAAKVKMLVQAGGESPFDLDRVAERVELIETDISVMAFNRIRELGKLLSGIDAGVLYCPYHPMVPLRSPCPVVTTVHDCILEEDPAFAGGRLQQTIFGAITRAALWRSAAVTVPSQTTAHAISRYYPHARIAGVASNGVDVRLPGEAGNATIAETRAHLALPDRYLLNVGARRPHKNQALLVKALAELDPSISLVIVGKADPRVDDPVGRTVERLGLRSRVYLLDDVPDRHMAGLYAGAELFVFPSIQEGYGIPPLEAMAAGVPVVASAIPIMAEVLGSAALLTSPFEVGPWVRAVQRVLDEPGLAATMTAQGREVARVATWDRGARALFDLLECWVGR